MGYTIKIGEAEVTIAPEENYIYLDVKCCNLDNAPEDIAYSKENVRMPSYTDWNDFCMETRLYNFFFNLEDGLMRNRPGSFLLNRNHYDIVEKAYNNYITTYPDAKTIKSEEETKVLTDEEFNINYNLNRLEWLKFWIDWALNNCKNPIIFNS